MMGFGTQWSKVASESDIARQLLRILEDRRVLFGERHLEDEFECVQSVLEIRAKIHELQVTAKPGRQLETSMRAILAACRGFLTRAGHDGQKFQNGFQSSSGNDLFTRALTELRLMVGIQVGLLANYYGVDVDPELASIVPFADEDDDDTGWLRNRIRE